MSRGTDRGHHPHQDPEETPLAPEDRPAGSPSDRTGDTKGTRSGPTQVGHSVQRYPSRGSRVKTGPPVPATGWSRTPALDVGADVTYSPVTMDLAGKNVLITGAARGIGAATARDLAARGARLALVGLEPEGLAALADELGPGHTWAEADVTDGAALETAVAAVVAELGGLDVVVANAGIASFGTVRTIDPEAFAKTVDVNLTGVFRTVHAALAHLIETRGYVLVVSSLAALVPTMGFSAYGASKAGVEAFADALRIEVAHHGVGVGCAHMSWIDTDMVRDAEQDLTSFRESRSQMPWPMNSVTSVHECSAAFVRAIERRSRRVNVPRAIGINHWIRPIVHSRVVDAVLARGAAKSLPRLEAEVTRLGRSVSEKVAKLNPGGR